MAAQDAPADAISANALLEPFTRELPAVRAVQCAVVAIVDALIDNVLRERQRRHRAQHAA